MSKFKANQYWDTIDNKWVECEEKIIDEPADNIDVYYTPNSILVYGKNSKDEKPRLYKCSLEIKIDATIIENK